MHSRDLEVAALSIQTRRLVAEVSEMVKTLRRHERDLNVFIEDVKEDVSQTGDRHE